MDVFTSFQFSINKEADEQELLKGIYIAVIHANRVPPHIGMIMDGNYCSLSIKGQDINTPVNTLIRSSIIRKTPALFIKIKQHATFSTMYQHDHFITNVMQFPRVDTGVATCLSPVRSFFEEVYNVDMNEVHFLYELLPKLRSEHLIESSSSLFIDRETYRLPVYTHTEINEGIEQVRSEFREHSSLKQ